MNQRSIGTLDEWRGLASDAALTSSGMEGVQPPGQAYHADKIPLNRRCARIPGFKSECERKLKAVMNEEAVVIVNVRDYMDNGLDVYDAEKKRVGTVLTFDKVAGYMTVRPRPFSERFLYIPFSAITHIDRREAFVEGTREELDSAYSTPPPRDSVLHPRTDPDTGEDESVAVTSEPNGYDGSPVVVDVAKIGRMAHHIAPGFHVRTNEQEDIGTIKQFNRSTGWMVVERGLLSKHDVIVPLVAVDKVDRDHRIVYLAVSSADLERYSRVS